MKRLWALALALVVVALGGIVATNMMLNPERSAQSSGIDAAEPQADLAPALRWSSTETGYYEIAIASDIQLAGATDDSRLKTLFRGTLALTLAPAKGTDIDLTVAFPDASFSINSILNPEVSALLATPFQVTVAANGLFQKFEFPDYLDAKTAAMLEEIMRSTQVIVEEGVNRWQGEESGRSGTFRADYRFIAPASIEKSNKHFTEPPAGSKGGMRVAVQSYNARATLPDHGNWLASFHAEEKNELRKAGDTVLSSTIQVDLEQTDRVPIRSWQVQNDDRAGRKKGSASAEVAVSLAESQARLTKLLAEFVATGPGKHARLEMLVSQLSEHDELCAELAGRIKNETFSDRDVAELFLVLELTASASAQAALSQLMDDPEVAANNRLRAIVAIGGISAPNEETLQALWDNVDDRSASNEDYSNTTALALGSISHFNRQADGEQWQEISDQLASRYDSAGDPSARSILLIAMANTGDEGHYRTFTQALGDAQAEVRIAAAQSLAKSTQTGTAKILMESFNGETDLDTRQAIAVALARNAEPDSEVLAMTASLVPQENDEPTRWRLAKYLAQHPQLVREDHELLATHLMTEPSARIRKTLANWLIAD